MALPYATKANVRERLGLDVGDTDDDPLLDKYCNQVNAAIEYRIGTPIGPSPDTERFYDGYSVRRDGTLFIRGGVRTLTEIAIASQTGGTFTVVAPADILLRPLTQDREPGWPAQYLAFSDLATSIWYAGYSNIRLRGAAGLAFGFDAIPDDLIDVGDTTVVRAWLARRTGETDVMGVDENNQPVISRFISPYHAGILRYYRNNVRRWYSRGN